MKFPSIRNHLKSILFPRNENRKIPGPGLYSYTQESEKERSRVHLRIDEDQSGLLLVNANRVLHLNPTAVQMAYLFLEGLQVPEAIRILQACYGLNERDLVDDYTQFVDQLSEVLRPDGACPVHDLDFEITTPFQAQPSAPYRMDLALTYRCNNECWHCYNARSRQFPELSTDSWFDILDRLWDIGIPHIVFTGGEPTLREDLPDLIAHAEKNGQITGINTNGRRLAQKTFVDRLVDAGLDHIQITLESHDPDIHNKMVSSGNAHAQTIKGIRNAVASNLYVMTNTTLLKDNAPYLDPTLDFLAELGVRTVGLNALIYSGHGLNVDTGLAESELQPLLDIAKSKTSAYGQRLIWYTPTQYCNLDPVQLDLGVKGCTAALYAMCIEPNGDVIPCQSYYEPLGNIQRSSWHDIWHHPLAVSLRNRTHAPEGCTECLLFQECGGGCPLHQTAVSPNSIPISGV
jgi:radical SAM protein with 4Fe4S-binding SPASM domain